METNIKWNELSGPALQEQLQNYCTSEGISDIHFAPEKTGVRLEVRLHGILEEIATLTPKAYEDFVRQIKFVSKLKLNVTNIPQDGHYTFEQSKEGINRTVNVRVASIPSRFGEKFTLRLLDPEKGIVPLEQLGFDKEIHEKLSELVQLPNGIILITGPTGSGKTTTLYALLNTIVGHERNIITLEDPVEYELPGIVQSQVDHEHDYTFSTGLRSILRHDPDVILVGEIRDYETAQTAIDAALTGHLVLSTLHTNSAIEAIPRLLAMGVSPYTFAPALRAVLAQRLVRTTKEECKGNDKCDPSNNETYDGRMALPELLVVTPSIRQMILDNESAEPILEQAKKEGYRTMQDWGKIFVDNDDTTDSEIMRVTM